MVLMNSWTDGFVILVGFGWLMSYRWVLALRVSLLRLSSGNALMATVRLVLIIAALGLVSAGGDTGIEVLASGMTFLLVIQLWNIFSLRMESSSFVVRDWPLKSSCWLSFPGGIFWMNLSGLGRFVRSVCDRIRQQTRCILCNNNLIVHKLKL